MWSVTCGFLRGRVELCALIRVRRVASCPRTCARSGPPRAPERCRSCIRPAGGSRGIEHIGFRARRCRAGGVEGGRAQTVDGRAGRTRPGLGQCRVCWTRWPVADQVVADGSPVRRPHARLSGAWIRADHGRRRRVSPPRVGPRRGVRRAGVEVLVPPGSRPARRVLTDHDRVRGARRVLHGIAPPS